MMLRPLGHPSSSPITHDCLSPPHLPLPHFTTLHTSLASRAARTILLPRGLAPSLRPQTLTTHPTPCSDPSLTACGEIARGVGRQGAALRCHPSTHAPTGSPLISSALRCPLLARSGATSPDPDHLQRGHQHHNLPPRTLPRCDQWLFRV